MTSDSVEQLKSVVFVAYAFPPEGSAGAYRPLRFVRHLAEHGWNASVVSAAPLAYERYDSGLLDAVPPGTEVRRVAFRDAWQKWQAKREQRAQHMAQLPSERKFLQRSERRTRSQARAIFREALRRAEAWRYHPDLAMPWIRPAVRATVEIVKQKHAAAIWATAGPVSSFVVARRAARVTGVPYLLDFRDAWTITHNDFDARRPAWAVRADRRAMYRLLSGAHAVTFRYHTEAECFWRAYAGALDTSRIHIIPNGYDGPVCESTSSSSDRCTILYAGTLLSYRYDSLLQAIQRIRQSDPVRARQLRLLVVGEGSETLAAEAARLGVSDIVATAHPKSHAEIEQLQQAADALLVLGRPPSMIGHELFAGAKLFSYLRAGRPIVGVLPEDETKRILQHVGVSTVADVDSPSEILAVLEAVVDAWMRKTLPSFRPNPDVVHAYSAERQTAALVRALEGESPAEPFVPNAVEVPKSLRVLIQQESWANVCHSARI